MKITKFNYTKKNGENNDYEVLILKEDKEHIAGIALNKLSEDEIKEVKKIQKEYEEKLSPFLKAYRMFLIDGINEKKETLAENSN